MQKFAVIILLTLLCNLDSRSTPVSANVITEQNAVYSYAYIRIEGKFLSKKLKVKVDLGDSELEIEEGEKLSEILTNKKSYAAVLNYRSEIGYELVNTLDLTSNYNGSGGTSGIVYVMKKAD